MKQILQVASLLILFLTYFSCSQNPSQVEKDYIKNLEEKNKLLEKELQEEKNKPQPSTISQSVNKKNTKANTNPRDYFTIGSTEDEVLQVMGDPTSYMDLGSSKLFHYGISSVSFENGKVESYSNLGRNLKVRVKK